MHAPVELGGTRGGQPNSLNAYIGVRRNWDFSPFRIVLIPIERPGRISSKKETLRERYYIHHAMTEVQRK